VENREEKCELYFLARACVGQKFNARSLVFQKRREKETDDSKEIYINGKQRIKARNRVEKKYSF